MNKLIEIFRAGTHTDGGGTKRVWTKKDLDEIVSKYSESEHEAPVVIGHPKTNDPAFGWVKKVVRKGNVLFAELTDVVQEFKEAFNKGMYKKRSIALYPDLNLKHVGFLGAMPPAIKGLADFKFKESEEETMNFEVSPEDGSLEFADHETSWGFRDVGRVFRGLREYFIAKGLKESADEMLPNYLIKGLEDFKATPVVENSVRSLFEENQNQGQNEMNIEELKSKNEALELKVSAFSDENTTLKTKLADAEKRAGDAETSLSQFQEEAEEKEVSSFCEDLVSKGKLAAGELPLTKANLLLLKKSGQTFEFGEGDQKKELSAYDQMKSKLEGAKASVAEGEFSQNQNANGSTVYGEGELSQFSEHGEVSEAKQDEFLAIKKIQEEKKLSFSEARREYMAN